MNLFELSMEQNFAARDKVREVAEQLDNWVKQTHGGGWSTHLVKEQQDLSGMLYAALGRGNANYYELLAKCANLFELWAATSIAGGWSTHQVEPLRKTARDIFEFIGRAGRSALGVKSAT